MNVARPYDDLEQLAQIACHLTQNVGDEAKETVVSILTKIRAIVETISTEPAAE